MAAPLPPPDSLDELSARIDLVELRVVRRDLEFRHHHQSLKHRAEALLRPANWLLPVLGTGSGWVFWKLFKRRRPRHASRRGGPDRPLSSCGVLAPLLAQVFGLSAASQPPAAASSHASKSSTASHGAATPTDDGRPEVRLLQTLTVLWGLAPAQWRGRFGPQTTQLLLGLIAGVLHGRQRASKDKAAEATQAAQWAPEAQASRTTDAPGGRANGPEPQRERSGAT